MPIDTWNPCPTERGDQFDRLDPDEQPNNPNGKAAVALCPSTVSSSIKSQATKTEIELIDPRILHPVEAMDQIQTMDETSSQPNAQIHTEDEKSIISLSSTTPILSLVMQSIIGFESDTLTRSLQDPLSEDCIVPENPPPTPLKDIEKMPFLNKDDSHWPHYGSCSDEAKLEDEWNRDSLLSPSNQHCPSAEPQQKAFSTGRDQLHRDAIITSPQTRAQKRARSIRDVPDCTNEDKKRMKLNAQEKQKLCELKSQRFTLRQIGPQFSSIDETVLQRAWENLRPSQRLTRSRAGEGR